MPSLVKRVTREPTAEEKQASVLLLSHINELRVRLGLRTVATQGRGASVRRSLPLYFTLGLSLHEAITKADAAAIDASKEAKDLLYPTRLAKLILRGLA